MNGERGGIGIGSNTGHNADRVILSSTRRFYKKKRYVADCSVPHILQLLPKEESHLDSMHREHSYEDLLSWRKLASASITADNAAPIEEKLASFFNSWLTPKVLIHERRNFHTCSNT